MVRFSDNNKYPSWKEQEASEDQDDADLSPRMMKTTTDILTIKYIDIAKLEGICEPFPYAIENAGATEMRNDKDRESVILFEKIQAILEKMDEAFVSNDDTAGKPIFDITTKDSSNDLSDQSDCAQMGYYVFGSKSYDETEVNTSDDSSIVSSSSSTVFEFFDDVSILTNEDFISDAAADFYVDINFELDLDGEDEDNDIFSANQRAFKDMPFKMEEVWKKTERNASITMTPLVQDDFFEDEHEEENNCMEQWIIEREMNTCNEFKDYSLFDLLNESRYDEGFFPEDELRMA